VIFLSWLNKLRNIFKDKSESDGHAEFFHDQLHEPTMNETRGKQLEARVTYQYPRKSSPVILASKEEKLSAALPRGNRVKRGERKATQEINEVVRNIHPIRKERPKSRLRSESNPPPILEGSPASFKETELENSSSSKKVEVKHDGGNRVAKITKKGSRPFRPTEIPSPIYGFSTRQKQNEIVEFELVSEISSLVEHKNVNLDENIGLYMDMPFKAEGLSEDCVFTQQDQPFIKVEVTEIPQFQRSEEVQFIEKWQSEAAADQVNDLLSEELAFQKEELLVTESEQQEGKLHSIEATLQKKEILIVDECLQVGDSMQVDASPSQDAIHIEEHELDNDQELKEELEQDLKQEHLVNTIVTEEVADVQTPAQTPAQTPVKRTHLPFNVMMLKQDKLRLENKLASLQPRTTVVEEARERQEVNTNVVENDSTHPISHHYDFPTIDLLNPSMTRFAQEDHEWIESQKYLLNEALKSFGVRANVVNITQGPSVTRFEVQPEPGVKVSKITNLSDDIKLSLAAKDIRIEAPIPGKHTIGIEVPNKKSRPVLISEIITSDAFKNSASPLTAVLGLDISGAPVVTDLKKMPHGLIAGATGSGKSVCINSILISLLFKATPQELKLLLIDPKMVELAPYNHIPHLVSPVITDVKAATAALKWAVDEMERRYELFAHTGVREINRFNEMAEQHKRYSDKLPFIVIIIDELADLMMMSPAEVEESICRIAQKARACGIHLIIATQRPSVDVITGLIKANVPTRTAFSVSSQIDSRTIIDISGAEKLLGRGDMLFLENGSSKPVRLQGTFVSDAEIDLVVEYVRNQQEPEYLFHQEELLKKAQVIEDEDELFYEACEFIIEQGGASTSSVQRKFKIGYNRAARLIDMMEQQGFISEPKGSKPRDVLITEEELELIQENATSTFA
jgi:DNA segregation ATPase FtsK/SpoIIIE, S-DNA-T family